MKRVIRIVVSVILLFAALLGAVFLVWPTYQEFMVLGHEVQERRDRLERGQKALAHLRKTQEEIIARQESFAKIDSAIPEDPQLPALYEHIQRLAASSHLVLTSIESKEGEAPANDVAVYVLKAEFQGSYEGLKTFLGGLKRSERILGVEKLTLSSDGEASEGLDIDMELSAYAASSTI